MKLAFAFRHLAALALIACAPPSFAATEPAPTNEVRALTAQQDHQKMLELLHITSLRRGADGNNPRATNYANYDEAKANPYPNLPDPLVLKNGDKVTTPEIWWQKRRPEIVEDFDREIYGRVPKQTPAVKWEVTSTTHETNGTVPIITKKLIGHVDNSSYPSVTVDIQLNLTTPAAATAPVPVIMELGFNFGPGFGRFGRTNAPGGTNRFAGGAFGATNTGPTWQQQVLAKGWGYAVTYPTSVQPDNGAGLSQGIIGLCNKGQLRKADDWGALRAWAWGASRALDYFETDKSVDAKSVGLEGHSRYGKAVLVAMAYDPRFAIVFVSSSGEGGAKLHRRNWGEIVENLAGSGEYHWMAGNFIKYGGPLNWNDLPVDSHELIAICAPRPVFISAGSTNGDAWVDAKGMFLAAAGAGPVYKLLGKKDLGATEFPPIETGLMDGDITFRQHSGGHTPGPNWPTFLTFASRYFASSAPSLFRQKVIRIKAGASSIKDADGNVWLEDQGFVGGETIERPELEIANTKSPGIYRAERYSMESFSYPVLNGKYTVKLHFAETFEGITGAGERVFSFNVEGHDFKDFDVWAKTGGAQRAYVETVNVDVADGKLDITFTSNIENPEINGIEIIPAVLSASSQ